ncbi:unnamed protein product, partial [Thelazia callipaeda]|uniref:Ig-like domain-containing protein n=1 Tax=Thelazia callipaeda TaxID=103827 RepID=A0A0N5D8V3_THECL
ITGQAAFYHFPTNTDLSTYENRFVLNCPHVQDSYSEQIKVQVTWTKDEEVWLKIRNGELLLSHKLTTLERRSAGKKSVLQIKMNKGRYSFLYDEVKGNFSMAISKMNYNEDLGLWQCHVNVNKNGKTQSMTSRNRLKYRRKKLFGTRRMHHHIQGNNISMLNSEPKSDQPIIRTFSRKKQNDIEISRS